MKRFLLHPPKWLEKILSKSSRYRAWYIKETLRMLQENCLKAIYEELREEDE